MKGATWRWLDLKYKYFTVQQAGFSNVSDFSGKQWGKGFSSFLAFVTEFMVVSLNCDGIDGFEKENEGFYFNRLSLKMLSQSFKGRNEVSSCDWDGVQRIDLLELKSELMAWRC